MAGGPNIKALCENCATEFKVNNGNIKNREFEVNGQSIFLTYYDCPNCGRRHFVQIDDAKSKQMLVGVSAKFVKLAAAKNKGKTITNNQSVKFKKAKQNLSDYRMTLMKEFTGKLIHDSEAGTDFELRFSV